jgi:hypothetical protein
MLLLFVCGLSLLTGCSLFQAPGTLKVSLTDAPAVENFQEVNVTISEVCISKATEDDTDNWITLSNTEQTFDLMTLTGGVLADLGVKDLAPGQYNQIRLIVTEANVKIGDVTYPLTISSGTVKLVNPFRIQSGITTELVVDFNAADSILKNGPGDYHMTPVIRVTDKATTGAIAGTVALNPVNADAVITVATTDANSNSISTICAADGTFLLGYLPAGTYDLEISAIGYTTQTVNGITVTVGDTSNITDVVLVP